MMKNIRILLVDDVIENRILLSSIIHKNTDYEVEQADNGFSALAMVHDNVESPFDLVLLDIMMPELDGFQVADRIKQVPEYGDTSIIFITALTDRENVVKAFDMGGVDYITKPFNKAELLARINVHIKLKKANDELKAKNEALRQKEGSLIKQGQMLEKANTELEILNGEALKKNQELEELNRLKNKYIGILAHDLRNPISAILMTSEFLILRLPEISEANMKFLKTIYNSSKFMHELVNDLLDISSIESGKLGLKSEELDIIELIRSNININNIIASSKNIEICFDTDIDSAFIKVDRVKIEQAISNLITNAVKFSHRNSKINVGLSQVPDGIQIEIQDHGTGMDEDTLKEIFSPYNQKSRQGTLGERGTGLGLAIVKKIIDAHNGSINVQSTLNEGTTFIITLKTL